MAFSTKGNTIDAERNAAGRTRLESTFVGPGPQAADTSDEKCALTGACTFDIFLKVNQKTK